jgi:IS605 OrfB family transposase
LSEIQTKPCLAWFIARDTVPHTTAHRYKYPNFKKKYPTQLVRENQTIVVENLAVNNMVKNPKLSQAISDVSWGEIPRQLAYKCRWHGRNYLEIDGWFPSSNTNFQ